MVGFECDIADKSPIKPEQVYFNKLYSANNSIWSPRQPFPNPSYAYLFIKIEQDGYCPAL
jgi:hypothetical protein